MNFLPACSSACSCGGEARKQRGTGAILGEYLVLTGIARFLVEFIRRNPKILWNLSNAQLASLGSVLIGVGLILWASRHPANAPDEAARAG